jgi:hypothetical protein
VAGPVHREFLEEQLPSAIENEYVGHSEVCVEPEDIRTGNGSNWLIAIIYAIQHFGSGHEAFLLRLWDTISQQWQKLVYQY